MARTAEQHMRAGTGETDLAPVVVATRHGTVVAIEAATGRRLWQWVAEPRLETLAHSGETVYVATANPLPVTRVEGQGGRRPCWRWRRNPSPRDKFTPSQPH